MSYAIPGTAAQYCGPADLMPAGAVPMKYERPTPQHVAHPDGTWAMPLDTAKAAKLDAIHAEKNRIRDAGFLVDGVLFDSDLPARTSYAELAIAIQQDSSMTTRWKASDGVWVTMTLPLFQQVYTAGRAHIERCFAWQEAREREVAEAQTVDAVDAVNHVMNA